MAQGREFQRALADFVQEFANGGAIRHLADRGYTVTEIAERLSFPVTKEVVAKKVWKYFLESGKILLKEPEDTGYIEKVTYVREYGAYGKPALKRVVERCRTEKKSYLPCDFGRRKYRDPEAFAKQLEALAGKDREYVEDLPWPLETVYHEADERMERIMRGLEGEEKWQNR